MHARISRHSRPINNHHRQIRKTNCEHILFAKFTIHFLSTAKSMKTNVANGNYLRQWWEYRYIGVWSVHTPLASTDPMASCFQHDFSLTRKKWNKWVAVKKNVLDPGWFEVAITPLTLPIALFAETFDSNDFLFFGSCYAVFGAPRLCHL